MQRQNRLRRKADFDRVRAAKRTWRHPLLSISIAPNTLAYNRYGFVTSRHLGGAVVRNRVRRVLREGVRSMMPRLRAGYDVALIARNEIVGQPYNTVLDTLESLFKRAGLWQTDRQIEQKEGQL